MKFDGEITLGELIADLKKMPKKGVIRDGFSGEGHTDRGYYEDAAFDPARDVTVGEMLKSARALVGKTKIGWKGGEFLMDKDVSVCIGVSGISGDRITRRLVSYWKREAEGEFE